MLFATVAYFVGDLVFDYNDTTREADFKIQTSPEIRIASITLLLIGLLLFHLVPLAQNEFLQKKKENKPHKKSLRTAIETHSDAFIMGCEYRWLVHYTDRSN